MTHWKLLPWTCASMSFHMALDEILFRQREEAYRQEEPADRDAIYQKLPPLLRFYFADRPSVTIGYSHRHGNPAELSHPRPRVEAGTGMSVPQLASRHPRPRVEAGTGMSVPQLASRHPRPRVEAGTGMDIPLSASCHPREGEDLKTDLRQKISGMTARGKLPVIQRITGGGRVVHGKDIIFSLIAHKQHDESFHSVRISYWKIHEALKTGFETLGLKPRFYRCDEDLPEGPECFRYPISSDLALGKNKIAGGSQKRSAGTLLHQESVVVPSGINGFQLAEAFSAGFKKVFNTEFESEPIQPDWFEKAKVLAEIKYSPVNSESWIVGRK